MRQSKTSFKFEEKTRDLFFHHVSLSFGAKEEKTWVGGWVDG